MEAAPQTGAAFFYKADHSRQMNDKEKQAIADYERRQAFLEPFKRITDEWSINTTHRFQERIRELDLVASGDLAEDWTVSVIARDTGVVVAQFGFDEHGRYHDMRRVQYDGPISPARLESWVESKVDQGQIKYSRLASRLGVGFSDPRVIHDLSYRIARSTPFQIKRRRWYNKGKESSVNDLYDQLQEAMLAIVSDNTRKALTAPVS